MKRSEKKKQSPRSMSTQCLSVCQLRKTNERGKTLLFWFKNTNILLSSKQKSSEVILSKRLKCQLLCHAIVLYFISFGISVFYVSTANNNKNDRIDYSFVQCLMINNDNVTGFYSSARIKRENHNI